MPTVFPIIQPDGTSKQSLLDAIQNACTAIDDAIQAVHSTRPNPCDYRTQPAENLQKAQAQHTRRIVTLDALKAEFFPLYEAVEMQGK